MTAPLAARIGIACLILALAALALGRLGDFARLLAAGLAAGIEAECRLREGRA